MLNEIWKDIKGYEGLYQASNLGRLRSLDYRGIRKDKYGGYGMYFRKGKLLKTHYNDKGYECCVIYDHEHMKKNMFVHRAVALAFLPNPNDYPCINHKDENRANNNVDNLEWCSYEYNANYGNRIARIKEAKMGHSVSEATRRKISLSKMGKESPLKGQKRPNISASLKGKKFSDEHKDKMSASRKKMFENGFSTRGSKGMHWYNNGVKNAVSFECPNGYVKGRL